MCSSNIYEHFAAINSKFKNASSRIAKSSLEPVTTNFGLGVFAKTLHLDLQVWDKTCTRLKRTKTDMLFMFFDFEKN